MPSSPIRAHLSPSTDAPALKGPALNRGKVANERIVAGFEPAIPGLGGRCIIQLCYTPGQTTCLTLITVTQAQGPHDAPRQQSGGAWLRGECGGGGAAQVSIGLGHHVKQFGQTSGGRWNRPSTRC